MPLPLFFICRIHEYEAIVGISDGFAVASDNLINHLSTGVLLLPIENSCLFRSGKKWAVYSQDKD